jgi:hypothetical protein
VGIPVCRSNSMPRCRSFQRGAYDAGLASASSTVRTVLWSRSACAVLSTNEGVAFFGCHGDASNLTARRLL